MTLFYVGSALLLIAALLFILWPLLLQWRQSTTESSSDLREKTNIALYHDHLADLEQSLASGSIDQEQYDELHTELKRNLLEDSQSRSIDGASFASGKAKIILAMAIVLLLAFAVVTYQQLGSYSAWQVKTVLDERTAIEQQLLTTTDENTRGALQVEVLRANRDLVKKLQAYIESSATDLQMRALLARTLMTLGDYDLAIVEFQAILSQEPQSTQMMAELAQAVFLKAQNRVVPIVQSLVDKVLESEPNNTMALGLAGIGAFQSEKYADAIQFWQQAIQIQGVSSVNSIALERGIAAARQRLGEQGGIESPATPVEKTSSVDKQGSPEIPVSVSLADNVAVAPDTTVFIYARAWNGSRAPLAIARVQVSELPLTISLTNAMSMAPSMNLNTADQLELLARISLSGAPVPQSGDWQVSLGPIATMGDHTEPYQLLIEEQVQ